MAEVNIPSGYGIPLANLGTGYLPEKTMDAIGIDTSDRASRFDIRDYGAVCDGATTTVNATVGSAVITRTSGAFTIADIGKTIAVRGAGPVTSELVTSTILAYGNDGVWLSTIISVSGATATLNSTATSSVTGADCVYGTPDDTAVAAAQDAASLAGGAVYFPGRLNTIVTQSLTVKDYVQWTGAGMHVSHVWVLRDGLNWLVAPGSVLKGFEARDFAIHCWSFVRTSGYSASIKPLNISNQQASIIERMAIYDSPATAIPFDHAHDYSVVSKNFIVNPGRLGGSGYGPGSSGIGLGTLGAGNIEPCLVEGNTIIGSHTALAAGRGNNGIFLEAQSGSDPDAGSVGYKIIGNTIIGMPIGIADDGSRGTIITQNTVVGCGQAMSLNNGGVGGGYPGRDTLIAQNVFIDSVGPGNYDGIGVRITTDRPTSLGRPNVNPTIRTLLRDNVITGNAKYGIMLECDDLDIHSVTIRGNSIRENGLSGIRLSKAPGNSTDRVRWLAITDNQISDNGRSLVHGDDYGIYSSLKLYNHRIQNNDVYNLFGNPTQAGTIYLAASQTDGIVLNNAAPVVDILADSASVGASAMSGLLLPNGTVTTKAWALSGPGVWSYTGTAMKQTSGSTTLVLTDPSGLGVNTIYGGVHAKVGALAGASPFIGIVGRATDTSNYIRFVVHTTGMYRLTSHIAGVTNTLYDSAQVALVNDVIRMEIDDPYIRLYVNNVLIQEVTASATLSNGALQGTKWGMVGNFTTDPTSTLDDFGWTNDYRI